MSKTVLICSSLFDGRSDALTGPTEIQIEDGVIADIAPSIAHPASAPVVDLGDRTMNTGGYMSFGDDPAKVTRFEDEMQCLAETAP